MRARRPRHRPWRALSARSNRQVFDMRSFVLVLDSFGIGGAPDAGAYGDAGADTLGHIAGACARGEADNEKRVGALRLPNLGKLGLAAAYWLSTGPALEGNRS